MVMAPRVLVTCIACAAFSTLPAQVPITPLWVHVDPFGAGFYYPYFDILDTRVAFDQGTGKIYRAISPDPMNGEYANVQVFDVYGNDITPAPVITFHGMPGNIDGMWTRVVRLSANNDTLTGIVRFGPTYWMKVKRTDGVHVFLLGSGSDPLTEFLQDSIGAILLTENNLRSYAPTGWPTGVTLCQNAERMAVLGNDVILGVPPALTHIDRGTMTALAPIPVPSAGTASSGICMADGNTSFYYVGLNSNSTIDVGLMDLDAGLLWSTVVPIPSGAQATAYHVDELGNFWMALVHDLPGASDLGVLYRFYQLGGSYAVSSYGRYIDDITSSGSRLFLTGRVEGTTESTYLAAFDIDLITALPSEEVNTLILYPNPASTDLRLDVLSPSTSRVEISDATGRIVQQVKGPFLGFMSIPVSNLTNGAYLLRCSGDGFVATRHFSVLR